MKKRAKQSDTDQEPAETDSSPSDPVDAVLQMKLAEIVYEQALKALEEDKLEGINKFGFPRI